MNLAICWNLRFLKGIRDHMVLSYNL